MRGDGHIYIKYTVHSAARLQVPNTRILRALGPGASAGLTADLQWIWREVRDAGQAAVALNSMPRWARWVPACWHHAAPWSHVGGRRRDSARPPYSSVEYQARPSASSAVATATYLLGKMRGGRHSSRKRSSSVFGRFLLGVAAGADLA